MRGFLMCGWTISLGLIALFAQAQTEQAARPKKAEAPRIRFSPLDLGGTVRKLDQNDGKRVRVFVFLSTECPISNGYLVTLSGLQAKISGLKSAPDFFGVVYDPTVTRTAAAEHFAEYKAGFPILFDPSGLLVQVLKPSRVPEAFVLDGNGQLVYRGAIDNAWEALGRRRPKADKNFLADAIAAAVDGKPVKIAETKPVGCLIEMPPKDAERDDAASLAPAAKFSEGWRLAPPELILRIRLGAFSSGTAGGNRLLFDRLGKDWAIQARSASE